MKSQSLYNLLFRPYLLNSRLFCLAIWEQISAWLTHLTYFGLLNTCHHSDLPGPTYKKVQPLCPHLLPFFICSLTFITTCHSCLVTSPQRKENSVKASFCSLLNLQCPELCLVCNSHSKIFSEWMNNQRWMTSSGWLWGVSEMDLYKTDDNKIRSWKKTQACLTWKGLKISLPYAHIFHKILKIRIHLRKTISFLA